MTRQSSVQRGVVMYSCYLQSSCACISMNDKLLLMKRSNKEHIMENVLRQHVKCVCETISGRALSNNVCQNIEYFKKIINSLNLITPAI